MANEIKVTIGIQYANGTLKDTVPNSTTNINQAAQEMDAPVVSVGTSEQDFVPVGITTLGCIYLLNLDPTNYVTYGPKNSGSMVPFGRIAAGEQACLRMEPGITWRWKANTAPVKVQTKVYGN